jgi:hypothetical protein
VTSWFHKDVSTLPLREINDEIAALEKKPIADRTVIDVARLKDLRSAARRIHGRPAWGI